MNEEELIRERMVVGEDILGREDRKEFGVIDVGKKVSDFGK